jgi:FkbM family methyltransferase
VAKAHTALSHLRFNATDLYYTHSPTVRHTERMTPHGFVMVAGNSQHHRLMQAGTFEPDEVALVLDHLQRCEVFVDIGANIGLYSCLAESLGKHAVAIEPQEQNLRYLYASLVANGFDGAEVFPLGLAAKPGIETLYGVSSTGASILPGWAAQPKRFRTSIPVNTLDALLGARFAGQQLFIKLDVEGFEHPVLQGCRQTLMMQPQPTWMVEICLSEYHPGGRNAHYRDTFEAFFAAGYEAFTADSNRTPVTPSDVDRHITNGRSDSSAINYLMIARTPAAARSTGVTRTHDRDAAPSRRAAHPSDHPAPVRA